MEYRTTFKQKNAIVADGTMLEEIQNEILNYCDDIEYDSKLENGDSIKFDSLDELLDYENFKGCRIEGINITARKFNSKNRIHINIIAERNVLSTCEFTANVTMSTDSIDKKTLFIKNMENIFLRHEQDKRYNKISKNSILKWISIYYIICTAILAFQLISCGFKSENKVLLVIVIILTVVEIMRNPIEKIQKDVYPPIVFYIGDEKSRYDDNKARRNNFFWTVVVGGTLTIVMSIVGIIATIL